MTLYPKMQRILELQISNNWEFKPRKTQESSLSSFSLLVTKHSEGLWLQQKGGNQSSKDE